METRYYELVRDQAAYFSVAPGGRFERWDPATQAWVHVTSAPARDYFSRAIENGEAVRARPIDARA